MHTVRRVGMAPSRPSLVADNFCRVGERFCGTERGHIMMKADDRMRGVSVEANDPTGRRIHGEKYKVVRNWR